MMPYGDGCDFISLLFHQGFLKILESIFLGMPLIDIINCKKINSDWQIIVDYFYDSEIRRLKEMRSARISQEWKKKKPIGQSIKTFPTEVALKLGDDKHIFVQGCEKIFVLDANTLDIIHELELLKESAEIGIYFRSITMDKNFLFADMSRQNGRSSSVTIWKRDEKFSIVKTIPFGLPHHHPFPRFHFKDGELVTALHEWSDVCFKEIKLENWRNIVGQYLAGTHHHFILEMENFIIFSQYFSSKTVIFLKDKQSGELMWQKSLADRPTATVMGMSRDHVYVVWHQKKFLFQCVNTVQAYRIPSGEIALSFEHFARQLNYPKLLNCNSSSSVQQMDGRAAIILPTDVECDLKVFDLKTGHLLFQYKTDLHCSHQVDHFILEERRLLVSSGREILSFKFWE